MKKNRLKILLKLLTPTISFIPLATFLSVKTNYNNFYPPIYKSQLEKNIYIKEINFLENSGSEKILDKAVKINTALIELKESNYVDLLMLSVNINDWLARIQNRNNSIIRDWKYMLWNKKIDKFKFDPFLSSSRIWMETKEYFTIEDIDILNQIARDSSVKNITLLSNPKYNPNFKYVSSSENKYKNDITIDINALEKHLKAINVYNYIQSNKYINNNNNNNNELIKNPKIGIIEHLAKVDENHPGFSSNKIKQIEININDYPKIFNYDIPEENSIHASNVASIIGSKYGIDANSELLIAPFISSVDFKFLKKDPHEYYKAIYFNILFKSWVKAIDFFVSKGISAINHSYSLFGISGENILTEYLRNTSLNNSVLHIFSSGNDGIWGNINDWKLEQNSLIVGSSKIYESGKWHVSSFSTFTSENYNENSHAPLIVAPGENIILFNHDSGTSYSTPLITGLYSLFLRRWELKNIDKRDYRSLFKSILTTAASQKDNIGNKIYKSNGLELRTGAGMPNFEKMIEILEKKQFEILDGDFKSNNEKIKSNKKIFLKKGQSIKITLAFDRMYPIRHYNWHYDDSEYQEFRTFSLPDESGVKNSHSLILKRVDKKGNEKIEKSIYDENSNILTFTYVNNEEDAEFFYEIDTLLPSKDLTTSDFQKFIVSYLVDYE
ncbi:S8 family serine peptidase [Mycoplasma sp. 1018B]|uniref:S8 family serine peptidase n=1 Tax=Mycoplasma sp. 1018B TaxID=2967302 RepID=UPI00211CBEFA|nr:S8 family serine peptidase [Mycoplasma sp. 1018B]UUM19348.1 S8 family serine peptidase [Mycoplasma sp. 1018B]